MGAGGSTRKPYSLLKVTLVDHEDTINCMSVSDDGSIIATGSDDKTVRIWVAGVDDTDCLGILRGHLNYITCIAIHDAFIVTGSSDNTIRKWDATSCDCLAVYHGHDSRVIRLLCDETFIISGSNDHTAKVWLFDPPNEDDEEVQDVNFLRSLEGHSFGICALIYIPGDDDSPTILDKDSGLTLNENDIIITGSTDSTARSWSLVTGKTLNIFRGHKSAISCMAVDAQGETLYTGSMDNTIRIWTISTGNIVKILKGHEGAILSLHIMKRLLYSGSADNTAKCWINNMDVPGITYKGHLHTVSVVKYHEGYLFTASGDACARAYDAKSGILKAVYRGHSSAITCMCLLGDYLYTASSDKTLRVWDASRATLESEETLELMDEESDEENKIQQQKANATNNKLNGYTAVDVDTTSKPEDVKPPSPSRQSLLSVPSPTPSGRSRLSAPRSPSGRSRLSPSPSRLTPRGADNSPKTIEDLDL